MARRNKLRDSSSSSNVARVIIPLICLIQAVFFVVQQKNDVGLQDIWLSATAATGSLSFLPSSTTTLDSCTPASHWASHFDPTDLMELTKQNTFFHQQGGNVKSIQLLMDEAMQTTLDQFGIDFVPNNDEKNKNGVQAIPYLKDYYATNPSQRQGYGEPLPGKYHSKDGIAIEKRSNDHPTLMDQRWIHVVEPTLGRERWDASLGPIGPLCQNFVQLGTKEKDGYKYICMPNENADDDDDKPVTNEQNESDCQIISVGGNDNWKFEAAVMAQLDGCVTHTFDCTLPGGVARRKPSHPNVHFYNACAAGSTYKDQFGRQFLSYADMLKEAGLVKAPSYFKIDVEGYEYDIFSQMIQADTNREEESSLLPQQIQVEMHWGTRMTGLSWMPRLRTAAEVALMTNVMYTGGGYLPIHLDYTPFCPSCMEVLYFRTGGADICTTEED